MRSSAIICDICVSDLQVKSHSCQANHLPAQSKCPSSWCERSFNVAEIYHLSTFQHPIDEVNMFPAKPGRWVLESLRPAEAWMPPGSTKAEFLGIWDIEKSWKTQNHHYDHLILHLILVKIWFFSSASSFFVFFSFSWIFFIFIFFINQERPNIRQC